MRVFCDLLRFTSQIFELYHENDEVVKPRLLASSIAARKTSIIQITMRIRYRYVLYLDTACFFLCSFLRHTQIGI